MTIPRLFKRKSFYVILILVLAGGGYWWSQRGASTVTYETATVAKQDVIQTVEVTGDVKPASRIDLAFSVAGTLDATKIKIGDTVKAGDLLVSLKNDDLTYAVKNAEATRAVAQANLNARLAGETSQAIRVAETQVQQAQASYDKAVNDAASMKLTTADSVKTAAVNGSTAKNNLTNQTVTLSKTIQNAYDSTRTTILAAVPAMRTMLLDGDAVIGVDNTASNQNYATTLSILDSGALDRAKRSYTVAKADEAAAEKKVQVLITSSTNEAIVAAVEAVERALMSLQLYRADVQSVLAATLANARFSETELAAKKTTMTTNFTSLSTSQTSLQTNVQAIQNAELAKTQTVQQLTDAVSNAQTAFDTAVTNADVQVKAADTNVVIQKAALDAAKATLDLRRAPPRSVDVQSLRASLAQADVNVLKAQIDLKNIQILAPVDGIVADILVDPGERVSPQTPVVKLVGAQTYEVEANVPEADIAKVRVGQRADITFDAYGDEVKFQGTVIAEEPDQTKIQDAVYYKIRVQVDPAGHDVKPGMTANVTIQTDQRVGVIGIPLRAVRTTNGSDEKKVRLLKADQTTEERVVTLGLRGDEGRVEVLSGLQEGDVLILSEQAK